MDEDENHTHTIDAPDGGDENTSILRSPKEPHRIKDRITFVPPCFHSLLTDEDFDEISMVDILWLINTTSAAHRQLIQTSFFFIIIFFFCIIFSTRDGKDRFDTHRSSQQAADICSEMDGLAC